MKTSAHHQPLIIFVAAAFLAVAVYQSASAQRALTPDENNLLDQIEEFTREPAARADLSRAQWKAFTENLEHALSAHHDGLSVGALRMIIYYGEQIDLGRKALFDIMRLFRDHNNERVRRMAVVALGETRDDWAMGFLKRAVHFESSPSVRHTIKAVLANYESFHLGPALVGS